MANLYKKIAIHKRYRLAFWLWAVAIVFNGTIADAKSNIVFKGALGGQTAGGGGMAFSQEQQWMFEASGKFLHRDYKGAEEGYTKVLQSNNRHIDAYLQRAAVRREMDNGAGMQSDAKTALTLIDSELQQRSDADLYYERSLANRLLKQFDAAEQDLRKAMSLNKSANWDNDLKAIALERKMVQ